MNLEIRNFGFSHWRQKALRTQRALVFHALVTQALLIVFANPCVAANPVTVKPKPAAADKSNNSNKKISVSSNNQVANGKKLFEKLTCAGCHPNGENTLHAYRPLKGPGFLARYKEDGQIHHLIRTGVARAGMPAFNKTRLSDKNMKDLIAFIRSLTPIKK